MTKWRTRKNIENRKCYLMLQYILKKLNKSFSNNEESEGSSNEVWLKRKALENEVTMKQMLLLCLDMLELKLYARMDELQIMMKNLQQSQESHFKSLKKLIESANPNKFTPPLL